MKARTVKTLLAFGVGLGMMVISACDGRSDPYYPTGFNYTAPLRVEVDGATCYGYGSVDVFLDGTLVGTLRPGDGGVVYDVTIGSHAISARAVYVDYQWNLTPVYVPAEGRIHLLSCR